MQHGIQEDCDLNWPEGPPLWDSASRGPTLARQSPGGEARRVGVYQQAEIPPYPSSYAEWGQQKSLSPWVAPEMFSEGQIPPGSNVPPDDDHLSRRRDRDSMTSVGLCQLQDQPQKEAASPCHLPLLRN